jgi:ATP dependent DNA ligase-like protein
MAMRLPDPMLARPASLPLGSGYSYEVKWDGFRAIVSTESGLRVRSRRGWDMTALLPELAKLPSGLVLDGELVAPDEEGRPEDAVLARALSVVEVDFSQSPSPACRNFSRHVDDIATLSSSRRESRSFVVSPCSGQTRFAEAEPQIPSGHLVGRRPGAHRPYGRA